MYDPPTLHRKPPLTPVNARQTPDLRGLGIPHRKKVEILGLYGRRLRDPVHVTSQGEARYSVPLGSGAALPPHWTKSVIVAPPSLCDGSVSYPPPLRVGGVLEEESLCWKRSLGWRTFVCCPAGGRRSGPSYTGLSAACGCVRHMGNVTE